MGIGWTIETEEMRWKKSGIIQCTYYVDVVVFIIHFNYNIYNNVDEKKIRVMTNGLIMMGMNDNRWNSVTLIKNHDHDDCDECCDFDKERQQQYLRWIMTEITVIVDVIVMHDIMMKNTANARQWLEQTTIYDNFYLRPRLWRTTMSMTMMTDNDGW